MQIKITSMESLNLKKYLLYAVYIVRTHPAILLFLAAIGLLNSISTFYPDNTFSGFIGSLLIVLSIFVTPVIYGIYYEVIEEKYSSLINIFRTYVGGYLLLIICIYLPFILTMLMILAAPIEEGKLACIMFFHLAFSLLFIYIIPTYYISDEIFDSIGYGIRFFVKNFFASAPLFLMALFSELLMYISNYRLTPLKEQSPSLYIPLHLFMYMAATIIDFILFIMLVYIIRNQPIVKR